MTDTHVISPYQVWVMRPDGDEETGYTFPWDVRRWTREPSLIPLRFAPKAGAQGQASFQLLRRTRQDETDPLRREHLPSLVIPRAYVAITTGTAWTIADGFISSTIQWWGILGDLPGTIVESTDERTGEMEAYQVGRLFDQVSLGTFSRTTGSTIVDDTNNGRGWCVASADGYPVPISTPPTANIQIKDGHVIGNAKKLTGSGYSGYAFARLTTDCGLSADQYWTRWRLLGHIIAYCKPVGLPTITASAGGSGTTGALEVSHIDSIPPGTPSTGDSYLVDTGASGAWAGHDNDIATWNGSAWDFSTPATGTDLRITSTGSHLTKTDSGWETNALATYLDSTDSPEVYELRNLKYRGGLDMLFPFAQGLDWDCVLSSDGASWVIVVVSAADTSDYGVPAATLVDVDLADSEVVDVSLAPSDADMPDEVVYEGAPCLFGVSVSYWNRNLGQSWTGSLATDYKLSDPEERTQPQYEDVFTLFRLTPTNSGDLRRSNFPGDTATDDGPLVPEVVWNGTAAKLSTTSRCPYLPTARLANFVPWEAGRKSDGTDERDATRKAQPCYLQPRAFYWDHDDTHGVYNLGATRSAELLGVGRPEVAADDRGSALRVSFSPPHTLALNHFDDADDNEDAIIDWQKMVLTIGVPSDQRVRVAKRRQVNGADIPDAKVITRLIVRDDTLAFWCTLKGTLLGIDKAADAAADRVTATNVDTDGGGDQFGYAIRNDWAKCERNCKRLAAWAFRERASGTITIKRPDVLPSWCRVGTAIGIVSEPLAPNGQVSVVQHTVNAIIRGYEVTLGEAPQVVVSVDILPMPQFAHGVVVASPSSGGTVSPSIGGTVPQAVQQLQVRMADREREEQRRVIITPLPLPVTPTKTVRIIGGNLQNGVGTIKYVPGSISPSQLYDPAVDTVYLDGLGYGDVYAPGSLTPTRRLVRHNYTGYPDSLLGGDAALVDSEIVITVASGPSAGQTMRAVTIRKG